MKRRLSKNGIKPRILADVLKRVVGVARPQKIILFGSAARGRMNPHSDLDLLVIKQGRYHRGKLTEKIYLALHGAAIAVDVIVVTPREVEKYKDSHALVIAPALREGRIVYAA